ncbi:hypothetical protein EDD85DRAFT_949210 [Armillaria nabsnona]|nr:hypothetical protein EDD85DRAFT_949210 [Armillaria nabsnona]
MRVSIIIAMALSTYAHPASTSLGAQEGGSNPPSGGGGQGFSGNDGPSGGQGQGPSGDRHDDPKRST